MRMRSVGALDGTTVSVGALAFPGGASTGSSGAARILRTGAMDVGASGSFTVEFWLKPSGTASNNNETISEGADYDGSAVNGNIIWDADSLGTRGFIIGLSAGRTYLGVNNAGGEYTLIGSTDLRDNAWHHVAVQFTVATGVISIYVDGAREDTATGVAGAVNYDGNGPTTDSYHYIGKEKLDLTFGYNGQISEIRVSDSLRYTGASYSVPTLPFVADANTVGLYHLDEQAGTVMGDSSGNGFDGGLIGSPVASWVNDGPF